MLISAECHSGSTDPPGARLRPRPRARQPGRPGPPYVRARRESVQKRIGAGRRYSRKIVGTVPPESVRLATMQIARMTREIKSATLTTVMLADVNSVSKTSALPYKKRIVSV